ncbi:aminoglycoside phosphotransferase family protein [Kitasatospora sp. NBC_01250]|uniref:phosphotransferase n=1 Tax=Kitasatospora sp. NBC_01250 TaxID=2903571 RepID=UPI002E346C1B|nr:phosphotransferase [Kitasatospora sp. NBC_01250]
MIEDGESVQGGLSLVRREGESIRRPWRSWSAAVGELLRHLERVGFTGAPRVLGGGPQEGEEVLSLLHGEVGGSPWPPALLADEGVVALGRWLRDYHEAVRDFRPSPQALWAGGDVPWRPGLIMRHGDLGTWNSVWMPDGLVGVIDWDLAVPGEPIDDLAQLAWYSVPLRSPERQRRAGYGPDGAPLARRLRLLCAAYGGVDPAEVLDALVRLQRWETERIARLGPLGVEPWSTFLEREFVPDIEAERSWALARRAELLGEE